MKSAGRLPILSIIGINCLKDDVALSLRESLPGFFVMWLLQEPRGSCSLQGTLPLFASSRENLPPPTLHCSRTLRHVFLFVFIGNIKNTLPREKIHFRKSVIDYLRFYIPLKKISLLWRRHHYRWRATKFRPMLGAQGLWAGRDLYRATCCDTGPRFSGLNRRTAPFSRLLRHTRGCGGSILTCILTGIKQQ
jgi:hypothetical protein